MLEDHIVEDNLVRDYAKNLNIPVANSNQYQMTKDIKYSFSVLTNFHIARFLGHNNRTNDSFFWLEEDDLGDTFYFSSTLLNDFTNPQDIYEKANQILSIYEGIYKLLDRTKHCNRYFDLTELFDLNSGRIVLQSRESELFRIDIDFAKISFSSENSPINPIYILFENIVQDGFLVNLFFLLSNKVDYRMLYIIYDDIRYYLSSIGDKNFLKEFSQQLKCFTHTANNYEVLGFFARHGRTEHDPPKNTNEPHRFHEPDF